MQGVSALLHDKWCPRPARVHVLFVATRDARVVGRARLGDRPLYCVGLDAADRVFTWRRPEVARGRARAAERGRLDGHIRALHLALLQSSALRLHGYFPPRSHPRVRQRPVGS